MLKLNIPPGTRFGKLVVVREIEPYTNPQGKRLRRFLCRCDCGNEVCVRLTDLRTGQTKSCGCLHLATTHGMSRSPEYKVWSTMIQRCTNPNNPSWSEYGGRNITVCRAWLDFGNHHADMGKRPFPKAQIDRIDNDGGYWCGHCPECVELGRATNCRWTTRQVNGSNTRRNHWITWRGETRILKDWARVLGISHITLTARINRLKWSIDRAFTTPVDSTKNHH